jgi:hypothetical protein
VFFGCSKDEGLDHCPQFTFYQPNIGYINFFIVPNFLQLDFYSNGTADTCPAVPGIEVDIF